MAITVAIVAGFSAILLIVLLWIGSSRFLVPKRRPLEDRHHRLLANPTEYGLDLEHRQVALPEGIVLETILATRSPSPGKAEKTRAMAARLVESGIIPPAGRRGTIVLLHGRGGIKENMLSIAQRLVAADFRCLVYDARAHGSSEGNCCTFGVRETGDLAFLLDHYAQILSERGEELGPVGAFGNSLGAAVVLQALPGNQRIRAAVTVAPFANLSEIVTRSARRTIHPSLPDFLSHGSMSIAGWRGRFDPFQIKPSESVSGSTVPLYLMHGMRDGVIPSEHSLRILRSSKASEKVWREIPSAYHSNVLAEGGDDHYQEMIEFFIRHLAAPSPAARPDSITAQDSE